MLSTEDRFSKLTNLYSQEVEFERLHTNGEYGRTEIGLALCERIVKRHGGEI